MATVDKLTLQLDAEGMQQFIKSMEEAQKGLQKVRDGIRKTAEQNGLLDNKFERSSKKLSKIDKKKEQDRYKGYKLLSENFKQNAKSLDKMAKALLTVAGISFGFNSLMNRSSQAAATSTDYANRSRNSAATAQQLEALDNTARAENVSIGALNEWAEKFSLNQSAYKSGKGGGDLEVKTLVGAINGLGLGAKIDVSNTDPIETMKAINRILLKLPAEVRATVLKERAGLTGDVATVLSSDTFEKNLNTAMKHTIQTPERIEAGRKNQADLTYSWVDVQNQWNELGQSFTPFVISMNKIAATILKEVNKLEPQIEAAMPKLEKVVENILKWTSVFVGDLIGGNGNSNSRLSSLTDNYISKNGSTLESGEKESISEQLSKISSVNSKDGIIKLDNGRTYEKGKWSAFPDYVEKYFNYLLSNYDSNSAIKDQHSKNSNPFYKLNDGKYQPASQLMGQQYATQNNSQSQVISINEMHVRTDANNVTGIVNDGIKSTHLLVGSAANILPFMPSTK